jgi:hypothetical protein
MWNDAHLVTCLLREARISKRLRISNDAHLVTCLFREWMRRCLFRGWTRSRNGPVLYWDEGLLCRAAAARTYVQCYAVGCLLCAFDLRRHPRSAGAHAKPNVAAPPASHARSVCGA